MHFTVNCKTARLLRIMDILVMSSILKKISSFFYVPAKEFNKVKFRYASDETEIEYTLKGSIFGIPIYLTISEDSMKSIIDFCNNKNTQNSSTETYYNF